LEIEESAKALEEEDGDFSEPSDGSRKREGTRPKDESTIETFPNLNEISHMTMFQEAVNHLKIINDLSCTKPEDEFDYFGNCIVGMLKQLPGLTFL
jgi:hypothetical protein